MKSANAKSLEKFSGKRPPEPAAKRDTLADSKNERTRTAGIARSIFPVVGLGASAGGLEALEEFFRKMPANNGMAFVVVMHQSAQHVSLLAELLDKCTPMEVTQIREGMIVQPDCVYVVPPGMNVDLLNGTLHLTKIPPKQLTSLPIDYFFRSLAADRRQSAVAIVLSGTGSDGTAGLSKIKNASGMVMVQSVESAKFTGMPQNAIQAGWADFVLAPHEMPAQLMASARGPFLTTPRLVNQPTPGIQESLPDILLLLRRRCGHDFSGYKYSTICRRVERRMNVHQITDPKQYFRFLSEHASEAETLFKELLIGVTSFFRDPWAFEALAEKAIVPRLKEKPANATFRVWVPGCSTGEEAYSLAILLDESLNRLRINVNIQLFATDLDSDAIEVARSGAFTEGIVTDVSDARLSRYFVKQGSGYRIRKDLRDWIVFAPQNVIHDPPFTKLDLVTCRNLLIYLQTDLQKKLLTLFHYSLVRNGCLFLGTSETIGEYIDLFEILDSKAKVFRRKEVVASSNRQVEFPITVVRKKSKDGAMSAEPKQPANIHLDKAIKEMLVSQFVPPTVIVDEKGEILHVHGRTGNFLELAPGNPTRNILAMAREGLELELSSALRKAAGRDDPVVHADVPVKTNGNRVTVNITVQKITVPESLSGLLRVSFEEQTKLPPPAIDQKLTKSRKLSPLREKEIERELQHTRESLQRTIEELDASNEEMKSTNEELQSTNEELQSTNEELETSKEELQSLNEELQTVNAEHQEKIQDLSLANDDMSNLLNSTHIATIFLDNQLCIKRFTERARRVIHLIPTDLGRPLGDLTSTLKYDNLVNDAQEVLKTLAFRECAVQTNDGHWLLMRILPYRTSDDRINGLVMTFVDIDELKQTQIKLQRALEFSENIVATVREPLLVLDADLHVRSANRSFYRSFAVEADETIGRLIYELGNGQWNIPRLRELLDSILITNCSFEDFEVQHEFPQLGHKRMLLNARRIESADGEPGMILLAIEELKQ